MSQFHGTARVPLRVFILLIALCEACPAMGSTAGSTAAVTPPATPEPLRIAAKATAAPLMFQTRADATTYWNLVIDTYALPAPDARRMAKAFVRDRLGIDGDSYVVAHLPPSSSGTAGKPDSVMLLTDALMESFPEHGNHTAFAAFADLVGGIESGGQASPSVFAFAEGAIGDDDAKAVFARIGKYLLSRTGPGYVYNTFFAPKNVAETFTEERRALDEAFAIYTVNKEDGAYRPSPFTLSQVVKAFDADGVFSELPYVKALDDELDRYWTANRLNWPLLARYEFVRQARYAHEKGDLTDAQYALVMRRAAPAVPLSGPVTVAQLRGASISDDIEVRRLDINGYAADNILRFVGPDKGEVVYIAGGRPCFVAFASESDVQRWIAAQTRDPKKLDALLSHFSVYNNQDGIFWTGVKNALAKIASGTWLPNAKVIDYENLLVTGDVFESMRVQTEKRMRDDARMQTGTAWEAWRKTINRVAAILGPLGYIPPIALGVQGSTAVLTLGTGIDEGINGRTPEERRNALEQAVMAGISNPGVGLVFHNIDVSSQVDGHVVGYPMSPTRPPRLPYALGPTRPPRLPRLATVSAGGLPHGRWITATETEDLVPRVPAGAIARADGSFLHGNDVFVPWGGGPGAGAARVVPDGAFYRALLQDGTAGRIVAKAGNTWRIANVPGNHARGRFLARIVSKDYSADPALLDRAAGMLAVLGTPESALEQMLETGSDMSAATPSVVLALGHAFVETLPARLRDPLSHTWSRREMRLVAPLLAHRLQRSLVFHLEDGRVDFALLPSGNEVAGNAVTATALHVQRSGGQYFATHAAWTSRLHATPFGALAEASRRGPVTDATTEQSLRTSLADGIEGRSGSAELERMRQQWLAPLEVPGRPETMLENVSRMREALFDRYHRFTADEERHALKAIQELMPSWKGIAIEVRRHGSAEVLASFGTPSPAVHRIVIEADMDTGGLRTAYYSVDNAGHATRVPATEPLSPLLAAVLDSGSREMRTLAIRHGTDTRQFANEVLAKVVEHYDPLLPKALSHLSVDNPAILAFVEPRAPDEWTMGGREYVRLRHMDGRTQLLETRLLERNDTREILMPQGTAPRGTGRYLVKKDNAWYPTDRLREGFDLAPPTQRFGTAEAIAARLPPAVGTQPGIMSQILDAIPQPLMGFFKQSLVAAVTEPGRPLALLVDRAGWNETLRFETELRLENLPGPSTRSAPVEPADVDMPEERISTFELHGDDPPSTPGAPAVAEQTVPVRPAQPNGTNAQRFTGNRHERALITARRLRGMLREDQNIAIVGSTSDHVLTLILPAGPDTMRLMSAEGAAGTRVADLPAGTIVVDDLLGVVSVSTDYPAAVREIARGWERAGAVMKQLRPDGTEIVESPAAFVERQLSTPWRPNRWNPWPDPISESDYVAYVRYRHANDLPVRHAGLDWLASRKARRDYMSYFAPPFDKLPYSNTDASSSAPPAIDRLAQAALAASLN